MPGQGEGPGRPPSVGACAVSSAVTLYTAGHMARSASIIGRGTSPTGRGTILLVLRFLKLVIRANNLCSSSTWLYYSLYEYVNCAAFVCLRASPERLPKCTRVTTTRRTVHVSRNMQVQLPHRTS